MALQSMELAMRDDLLWVAPRRCWAGH